MRVFVTGAGGFIGRAVVASALGRGHEVVAMVRRPPDASLAPWVDDPRVSLVSGDLRGAQGWAEDLGRCDVVAHLAASFGDFADQFASTVVGTERLLAAMDAVEVRRLVLISTMSVYGYRGPVVGSTLDERSLLEPHPERRDDYTRTKLVQEQLATEWATRRGAIVTVVRPGAVYGAGKLWDAGMTMPLTDRWWMAIAPLGRQKLTYVENCAEAIVLAAEHVAAAREAAVEVLDVVDDDQPTQRAYAKELRRHGIEVPRSVPVPYVAAAALARAVEVANARLLARRARLPELLVPERLAARYRPLRYSNARAAQLLGWTPRYPLSAALDRIVEHEGASAAARRERRRYVYHPPGAVRRAVKLVISLALHGLDSIRGRGPAPLAARHRGVTLVYHDIPVDRRALFAGQLDALARLGPSVRPEELDGAPDGVWRICLTFDDGFTSFADHALPELTARGMTSTLFVPSALIAGEHGIPSFEGLVLLTQERLAELPPEPVEIGSHSRTHAHLPEISDAELQREVADSRSELAGMLGREVRYLAFPYGEHSDREVLAARHAGYHRAFSVVPSLEPTHDGFVQGRIVVDPDDWPLELRLKAVGAYRWMCWYIGAKRELARRLRLDIRRPIGRS